MKKSERSAKEVIFEGKNKVASGMTATVFRDMAGDLSISVYCNQVCDFRIQAATVNSTEKDREIRLRETLRNLAVLLIEVADEPCLI